MSAVQSRLEELEKIHRASNIDLSFDKEFQQSSLIPLIELLGYRKRVAQEVIKSGYSDESYELFNYTNDQIKKLLAI